MDSDQRSSSEPSPKPRPFQFSLATMFVMMTAFALVLAICFMLPDPWSGAIWLVLTVATPPVLAVVIRFGPERLAAFCIGALVPTGMSLAGLILNKEWEYALPRSSGYVTWPAPSYTGDRLVVLGNWLVGTAKMGALWRPIALSSWVAAIVVGLLCVVVRRWVRRISQ
jgi:hypothetical protein